MATVAALPDLNDFALHGFLSQEWMFVPITVSRYALAVLPNSEIKRISVNPCWLGPLHCKMLIIKKMLFLSSRASILIVRPIYGFRAEARQPADVISSIACL